jgi:hypothetical protein
MIQNLAKPCMAGDMKKQHPSDLRPRVGRSKFAESPLKFPAMLALAGKIGPRPAGNMLDMSKVAR